MSSGPAAPPPTGQLVDVGGYRLHLACQGQGGPTAVIGVAPLPAVAARRNRR